MSSSLRRHSSSGGSGAAPVSATGSSPSASASASSRRSRPATAKRRRYLDLENRCRNPFCGAVLENKKQRYCDGSRFCQLRRGFALLCAWPQGIESGSDDDEPLARSLAAAANGSARPTTAASDGASTPRRSPTPTAAPTKEAAPTAPGEKRPRSSAETPATDHAASKKPRALQRHASTESMGAVETPPPTTPTTAAQQVKAAAIDVVPLGVGNRAGGGGRYVRSGNRIESSSTLSIVRPPSFSRFPPSTGTLTGAAESPLPPTVPSAQPSPSATSASVGSSGSTTSAGANPTITAPPSRVLTRANSLPVTTTNRSRDPRVRTAANSDGSTAARKTISPADYHNQLRNKDTSAVSAYPPVVEPNLPPNSTRPPDYRPLNRTEPSSASLQHAPPPETDFYGPGSSVDDSSRQLRRTQSDTAARTGPYESQRNASYESQHNHAHENDDWDRRRSGDYSYDHIGSHAYSSSTKQTYENSYGDSGSNHRVYRGSEYGGSSEHYDRGHYHDPPPLPRASLSTPTGIRPDSDSIRIAPVREIEEPRPARSAPQKSRAEKIFEAMLRPKFSHCDPFLKLIITRMASFLPGELRAVTNQTTTARKLKFYLDYTKRVEKCCGRLVKLTNNDGVARLMVADREWMTIHGTSTTTLYHQILEQLFRESEMWRSLITELKSIHASETRTRGGGAIPGVSFLKLWSAMKSSKAKEASDFDFQSNFTAGNNRFHWSFTVGNVEVGSGSAAAKIDAFKDATASAFAFLNSLTILPPQDKNLVEQVDGLSNSQNSRQRSPPRAISRPSSADSSSYSSKTRADTAPRPTRAATSPRPTSLKASQPTEQSSGLTSSGRSNSSSNSTRETIREPSQSTTLTSTTIKSADQSPAETSEQLSADPKPNSNRQDEVPPAAGEPRQERSDSWDETTHLDASFSPVVLSERSVSDDEEDRMSISSSESATPSNLNAPVRPTAPAHPSSQVPTAGPNQSRDSIASVPQATPTTSAPAVGSLPACRFCADMQSVKPGAMCLRCVRVQSSRGSGTGNSSATANANGASNRNITALQSIMRQSTSVATSSQVTTTGGALSSTHSSSGVAPTTAQLRNGRR